MPLTGATFTGTASFHGSQSAVQPLVSIITIVFNGEKFLEQTIQSVINQTYPHIEYIIVDGGSTDGTIEIIKRYSGSISRWISEPDQGISDAFNKGIRLATGQLIGIINADDWFEPEAVAAVVDNYKPGCVLHGNLQYWNQDGSKALLVMPKQTSLPRGMTVNHPTVFLDRELYSRYGMFDTSYKMAMDYHLLLRLYKADVPFIYINKTLANMRFGGTSDNWVKSYQEVLRAKQEVLGKSYTHHLTYHWQIMKRRVSEGLAHSPLSFINTLYRNYFSSMKKV
ncbi:glycosyltransferase family 2 protein [Pontibacter litorisediminis]|uniref:glycosyltransferase family 2 protein n=1 Tax=Pontibacter litorisediminis TaxID=1846260 RepID=UPI0023EAD250|nr:glycosyltransferase family 2 protein [Pontibacter litorisediminis]